MNIDELVILLTVILGCITVAVSIFVIFAIFWIFGVSAFDLPVAILVILLWPLQFYIFPLAVKIFNRLLDYWLSDDSQH